MNRYELINKLARKAGIPDYDALSFFEIFILKLFNKISAGQFVHINDIGYFLAKKGIYKKGTDLINKEEEFDQDEIDLIIFSREINEIDNADENNMFLIPHSRKSVPDELASHFNFSIGKPIINIDNPKLDDKIINVPAEEIHKLHNHKADEIISSVKIVDRDEINKPMVVHDIPQAKIDDYKSAVTKDEPEKEIPQKVKKDESSFVIDRGREFDNRGSRERNEEDRYQTLPWNFGTRFPLKEVEYKTDDKPVNDDDEKSKTDEALQKENTKKDETETIDTQSELESEISEIVGNYQRVKPFSLEAKERIDSRPIVEIKEKKPLKTKKPIPLNVIKDSSGYLEVKSKSESYHLRDTTPQKRKWKKESPKDKSSTKRTSYNESIYKKKSRVMPFFIILLGLVIVAGVGYLYLEEEILGGKDYNESFVTITRPPNVNVIERDFTIPVSYPSTYNESEISGIDPSILNIADDEPIEQEKTNEVVRESNVKEKEIVKPTIVSGTTNNVKEKTTTNNSVNDPNIFQSGDYFIVQLSSYSDYALAETEAEKYNNMGYNAVVEMTEVPGSGTRYRVRVGDFTSVEHAARFKKMHAN